MEPNDIYLKNGFDMLCCYVGDIRTRRVLYVRCNSYDIDKPFAVCPVCGDELARFVTYREAVDYAIEAYEKVGA